MREVMSVEICHLVSTKRPHSLRLVRALLGQRARSCILYPFVFQSRMSFRKRHSSIPHRTSPDQNHGQASKLGIARLSRLDHTSL